MYQPLVPCPSCNRHVRATEAACPFCASALPHDLEERAVPGTTRRLSRAAAFVFGASLAISACSSEVSQGETAGSTSGGDSGGGNTPDDDGGAQALYGDPAPQDAGPDDDGGGMAKYGGPPPPQDGGPDDDGGGQAEYGGPPPEDGGTPEPLYGSPPPPP